VSIIRTIGGWFSGITNIPGDIVRLAEAAWNGLRGVWSWAVGSYKVLDEAWTWVVHGVEWFGSQVTAWGAYVFGNLWQLVDSTIPNAIEWVYVQGAKYAARAVNDLERWAGKAIDTVLHEAEVFAHDIMSDLRALFDDFARWATGPVRWVLQWGAWLVELISHPERLANWIAGAIVLPVVRWLLLEGASVLVWLLEQASEESTDFAETVESAFAKVL
jgi:hypothetical protein